MRKYSVEIAINETREVEVRGREDIGPVTAVADRLNPKEYVGLSDPQVIRMYLARHGLPTLSIVRL